MQLRVRHIARNVLCNWLATAASMAVGFFLSPYVVHRLGSVAYGVWVLAISSVSYLVLLDLGMRSSVLRFVSKGYTQGDHEGASEAFSAALWVRVQISLAIVLLSLALAYFFPHMFRIPPELATDARHAVIIIGFSTAIAMSMGVFGGVLSGLNRYDLQSGISILYTALRVVGVVVVLRSGMGIVAIALAELAASLITNSLLVWVAIKRYPELRIRMAKPRSEVLRQLWSYSIYAFMVTVALQVIYQTDNLVVGAFVSASAVTVYSIGNSLCRYADQLVVSMTITFVPAASTYDAAGNAEGLRALYRNGTRATLAISLPVLVTFLVRGRSFIGLWMGAQYASASGPVLIILTIALLFSMANNSAAAIAYGTEKHKILAKWAAGEAVANLALSLTLVRWFGIYGVAIGTLLPSLVVHLVLWPRYAARLLGLSLFAVYWQARGAMFVAALPFAAASYAVETYMPARNLFVFVEQCAAITPIFFAAVALIYFKEVRGRVSSGVRSLRASASAHK